MITGREHGISCPTGSEIRRVETSRMPYWAAKSTRHWLGIVWCFSLPATLWLAGNWYESVLLTLVCLAAFYQVAFRLMYRTVCMESRARHLSDSDNAGIRFEVYGDSSELTDLQGLISESFEPYIVRSYRIINAWIYVIWTALAAGFSLVIRLMWSGPTLVALIALISLMVLPVFAVQLLHSYYRIYPGRLDRLVSGPFTVKTRLSRTIALTDARIVCRLDKDYISITPSGELNTWMICLKSLREPREFVRKVLQGAMAKPNSAKLPDDALLG